MKAASGPSKDSIIDCITTLAKGVFEQNNIPSRCFMEELVALDIRHTDIKRVYDGMADTGKSRLT
jgi:hypothetical protein